MPNITYKGQTYAVADGQTILEALNLGGVDLASGCKVGACQTCMLKAQPGPDLSAWQANVSTRQAKQRLFVTCIAKPTEDMDLIDPKESVQEVYTKGTITELKHVTDDIVTLTLDMSKKVAFKPGQFVQLLNEDGCQRPYSIASLPNEDHLEFQIRLLKDGKMSEYLECKAQIGSTMNVSDAMGTCIYPPKAEHGQLFLIGTGTGLAPLWSIARHALETGFTGPIHLFHGSRHQSGLYLVEECRNLAESHSNVLYHPCLSGEDIDGFYYGRVHEPAIAMLEDASGTAVYLCGHPDMVKESQKKFFLKGSSLNLIFADPFTITGK